MSTRNVVLSDEVDHAGFEVDTDDGDSVEPTSFAGGVGNQLDDQPMDGTNRSSAAAPRGAVSWDGPLAASSSRRSSNVRGPASMMLSGSSLGGQRGSSTHIVEPPAVYAGSRRASRARTGSVVSMSAMETLLAGGGNTGTDPLGDDEIARVIAFVDGHIRHNKLRTLGLLGVHVPDKDLADASTAMEAAFKSNYDESENVLPPQRQGAAPSGPAASSADRAWSAGSRPGTPQADLGVSNDRLTSRSPSAGLSPTSNMSAASPPHVAPLGGAVRPAIFPTDERLQRLVDHISAAFRHSFEEVALHSSTLGKEPFSHRDYHQALERSVANGIEADVNLNRERAKSAALERSLEETRGVLERHDATHRDQLQTYLVENLAIREHLREAQAKLQAAHGAKSQMAPPVLLVDPALGAGDGEDDEDAEDEHETEVRTEQLLGLVRQERDVLKHTVEQRDRVIADLRHKLAAAEQTQSTLASDMRTLTVDHDDFDERVMGDIAARDEEIVGLQQRIQQLESQTEAMQAELATAASDKLQLSEEVGMLRSSMPAIPPDGGFGATAMSAFGGDDDAGIIDDDSNDDGDGDGASSNPFSATRRSSRLGGSPGNAMASFDGDRPASAKSQLASNKALLSPDGPSHSLSILSNDRPGSASNTLRKLSASRRSSAAAASLTSVPRPTSAMSRRPSSATMTKDSLRKEVDELREYVTSLEFNRDAAAHQIETLAEELDAAEQVRQELESDLVAQAKAHTKKVAAVEHEHQRDIDAREQQHAKEIARLKEAAEKRQRAAAEAAKATFMKKLEDKRAAAAEGSVNGSVSDVFGSDGSVVFGGVIGGVSHRQVAEMAVMNHQAEVVERFLEQHVDGGLRRRLREHLAQDPVVLPEAVRTPRSVKRLCASGVPVAAAPGSADEDSLPSAVALAAKADLMFRCRVPDPTDSGDHGLDDEDPTSMSAAAQKRMELDAQNFRMQLADAAAQLRAERERAAETKRQLDDSEVKVALAQRAAAEAQQSAAENSDAPQFHAAGLRSLQNLRQSQQKRLDSDDAAGIFDAFPGADLAPEYRDVLEAAQRQRGQLQNLVRLCAIEAERKALAPDDEEQARALLRKRFDALRAVDAESAAVLRRLKTKHEDIMRRRTDELEHVVESLQHLTTTHPKEVRHLVLAAHRGDQHATPRALNATTISDPFRLTGVVERPASALSGATAPMPRAVSPIRAATPDASRVTVVARTPQRVMDVDPSFEVSAHASYDTGGVQGPRATRASSAAATRKSATAASRKRPSSSVAAGRSSGTVKGAGVKLAARPRR